MYLAHISAHSSKANLEFKQNVIYDLITFLCRKGEREEINTSEINVLDACECLKGSFRTVTQDIDSCKASQ